MAFKTAELRLVREDVRIGVRGHCEVALANLFADPRPRLPAQEAWHAIAAGTVQTEFASRTDAPRVTPCTSLPGRAAPSILASYAIEAGTSGGFMTYTY